ncbi:unnamed protein product [Anisakis simplex]|uniref:Dysbindin protein homolog (inferred by orthology to a C. elegans protein) n=1 Tax=Anisakis simplex TaxID=6269 RepID=A0A0M3JVQ2_ANISI|nr:unnamed protein product [Anisakis simplex]
MNNENFRLANLCSTRMGRAQQMCNESAECILSMHQHFRALPHICKQLRELNRQIDKLKRFCVQTELVMTHLEALQVISNGERIIEEKKADLKKEKDQYSEISKEKVKWISAQPQTNIFTEGHYERRMNEMLDANDEKHEEVMLEEFLNH